MAEEPFQIHSVKDPSQESILGNYSKGSTAQNPCQESILEEYLERGTVRDRSQGSILEEHLEGGAGGYPSQESVLEEYLEGSTVGDRSQGSILEEHLEGGTVEDHSQGIMADRHSQTAGQNGYTLLHEPSTPQKETGTAFTILTLDDAEQIMKGVAQSGGRKRDRHLCEILSPPAVPYPVLKRRKCGLD